MIKAIDALETERLVLRGIEETDTDSIVEWRSNPQVYCYFRSPHKITDREHLEWYYHNYLEDDNKFNWVCIEKKTNKKVGLFALKKSGKKTEISYLLAPDAQHKGFATEVLQKLIDYAYEKLQSEYVYAEIHKDNLSSVNLVERLGFKLISEENNFQTYSKKTD